MTHGSLFSGIGGFDLAAEWMGWENKFHCEWNEFGQKVLHHYWPQAELFTDITKSDFKKYNGTIDIISGGFPCQPYSSAGKRLGKEDSRHLWPEMLRAIREIQPRWVVGENVRGLTNWNGGLVFDEVQSDLEAEGYEVTPFLLPACAVNAPHRRDRIFFVAYSNNARTNIGLRNQPEWSESDHERRFTRSEFRKNGNDRNATNTNSNGLHQRNGNNEINTSEGRLNAFSNINESNGNGDVADTISIGGNKNEWRANGKPNVNDKISSPRTWQKFPTVPPIRMRDDGVSNKLLRFVVKEFYDTISYTSQENRIKNLQEVWAKVQSEEIWEQIRGFYSLESKDVLLQTMQLYSTEWNQQGYISPFSKKFYETILQHLSKHKEFRCSPQGQELEKQRFIQFGNTLSFLPHEIALAARRFEAAISKFESWHRNESIKAAGNAIVPQVVYQIFKAIEQYEKLNNNGTGSRHPGIL